MKKQGFAMITTIISLAIILGIFFNYNRATRSKKKMMQSSMSNMSSEKSVQESNSVGIYEMYLADQIITANNLKILQNSGTTIANPLVGEATAIQNILGYFTVKDSQSNVGLTDQAAAIKIWENDASLPNNLWYYGKWTGSGSEYVYTTYKLTPLTPDVNDIPITKGGYIITSIIDKTEGVVHNPSFIVPLDEYKIPILDTSGTRVRYPDGMTPKGRMNYHGGTNNTVYEVKLFKNVTLLKKSVQDSKTQGFINNYNYSEVVRSYNIYVTLLLYWTTNVIFQQNDLNLRNNCSAAPDPGVSVKVGTDCGVDSSNKMIVSKVESFIIEDITPTIE